MIVKLQRQQNLPGGRLRAYSEDKSIDVEVAETRPLLRLLKGRPKAYFEATINAAGELSIDAEAPEQAW